MELQEWLMISIWGAKTVIVYKKWWVIGKIIDKYCWGYMINYQYILMGLGLQDWLSINNNGDTEAMIDKHRWGLQ